MPEPRAAGARAARTESATKGTTIKRLQHMYEHAEQRERAILAERDAAVAEAEAKTAKAVAEAEAKTAKAVLKRVAGAPGYSGQSGSKTADDDKKKTFSTKNGWLNLFVFRLNRFCRNSYVG